jgi:hypothetical protein
VTLINNSWDLTGAKVTTVGEYVNELRVRRVNVTSIRSALWIRSVTDPIHGNGPDRRSTQVIGFSIF